MVGQEGDRVHVRRGDPGAEHGLPACAHGHPGLAQKLVAQAEAAAVRAEPEQGDGIAPPANAADRLVPAHGDAGLVSRRGQEVGIIELPVRGRGFAEPEMDAPARKLAPAALPGVAGELRGKVGIVIEVVGGEASVLIPQQTDGGVVSAGGVMRDAEDAVQPARADAAVREDSHGPAGMGLGSVTEGSGKAGGIVRPGLGPVQTPFLRAVLEGLQRLRLVQLQIPEGPVLPGSDRDLAQTGVQPGGQAVRGGDGLGGLAGAAEVAGIDRVKGDLRQPLCKQLHLAQTDLGQTGVVLPVHPAEQIALRLGVSDQV